MDRKVIVYINPGSFFDTDITVLHHLSKIYRVIWFPIVQTQQDSKISEKELLEYAHINDIDCHLTVVDYRLRDMRNLFLYCRIVNEAKKANADIIFTCYKQIYLLLALKILFPNRKIVYGFHDVRPHTGARTRLVLAMVKMATKWFRNFVTFSKGQQQILKDDYHKDSFLIGMSSKYLGESNLMVPPIDKKVKLLFFGSIIKYKGVDLLIKAMEDLYDEGIRNMSVTIAGKGEAWEECRSLITHNELFETNIKFIDNCKIPDLVCYHHFLVQPYRDVTNSGPLMIAFAYGLPVVAPNIGCFGELLDKNSAVLYEQGHLKDALKNISTMTTDIYQLLCKGMTKLKKTYSEESIAKKYIKCFESIIEGNESKRFKDIK